MRRIFNNLTMEEIWWSLDKNILSCKGVVNRVLLTCFLYKIVWPIRQIIQWLKSA